MSKEYEEDYCEVEIDFPPELDAKIERYAEEHGIDFSEATCDLLSLALSKDPDTNYAPRVSNATRHMVDSVAGHVDDVISQGLDDMFAKLELPDDRDDLPTSSEKGTSDVL